MCKLVDLYVSKMFVKSGNFSEFPGTDLELSVPMNTHCITQPNLLSPIKKQ